MITKHDDLLGTLIHDVAHLLRLEIDNRLTKHNLTRAKWLALGIISANPNLTQRELAEHLETGSATVGRLVDRLIERGFVERKEDPSDRRAYQLVLTGPATKLLKELELTGKNLRSDVLNNFNSAEVNGLNEGLKKLKSNLKSGFAGANAL